MMTAAVEAMATNILELLLRATLASSLALLLLWPLRSVLRRRFGASVAYAAWWLLPAVLIACLLPGRTQEAAPTVVVMSQIATQAEAVSVVTPASISVPTWWWIALWAIGAISMMLSLWRQQRGFERALGELQPLPERLWRSETSHGLPAVIGAMRARIVLPEDFAQRYDHEEQRLMIAHERTHLHRGDPLANLAVAALRCLFWFNPLAHLAAARFRHDQELACDQAVIATHPDSRRAYGEAMLKTLTTDRQAPLGCHWGFSHPLKERVMQLKLPSPRPWTRRAGIAAVMLLTLGAGFAVWSAQPPRVVPASTNPAMATSPALENTAGIRFDHVVEKDGVVVARPSVWTPFGQPATIALDNAVRVVSVAQAPRGNVSDVTSEFYVYSQGQWVRDRSRYDDGKMRMDARIDQTPSFERSMSNGYRVTVMQRKASRPSERIAPTPMSIAPSAPLQHESLDAPLQPLEPLEQLEPLTALAPLAPEPPDAAPAPDTAPMGPPAPPAPPSLRDMPAPPAPPAVPVAPMPVDAAVPVAPRTSIRSPRAKAQTMSLIAIPSLRFLAPANAVAADDDC